LEPVRGKTEREGQGEEKSGDSTSTATESQRKRRWAQANARRAAEDLGGCRHIALSEVADMTKENPFSATFKLEKETKNTVRYAEGRRPVVGTVYIDKYELPKPYPQTIRVTIEPAE
jgi:hypothetical protein